MKNEVDKRPLSIPCVVKPGKHLYFMMPLTGIAILAAVYISSLRTGYLPDMNYMIISAGIIAVLSVLMIFVINIYNIRFEFDHFEWRDFIKKKEIIYSTVTEVNAYMGMKGKRQYSYIELQCSTRDKLLRMDTKYFDKQKKSEIIRLICMKSPNAKLNRLALDLKEMKYKEYSVSEKKILLLAVMLLVLMIIKVAMKILLK